MKDAVLKPIVSEKTYALSRETNAYTFVVPRSVNKMAVKAAVEQQFKVTVTDVRMVVTKGKTKRSIRRGGRAAVGKRPDQKKAYVSLKQGDKIAVFEEAA